MYATTTTGHQEHTSLSKDSKCLQMLNVWGTNVGVLIQDTETIIEQWFGLSWGDAQTVCTSSESSTLNGSTRSYLGGAVLSHDTQYGSAWVRVPTCWGTKITSACERMGNTNLYHVTKTTTNLAVRAAGGSTIHLTLE